MRAVIAFIRTLEAHQVPYGIVASGMQDLILHSAYKIKVGYVRKNKDLELAEILCAIHKVNKSGERCLLAPSTEYLNRFLLKHRAELETMNCVIPLVNENLYETISDKEKFSNLCSEYHIVSPREVLERAHFKQPVIAKPNTYIASDGKIYAPTFLLNEDEFKNFVSTHRVSDFTFQEFLMGGISYYLLFYFSKAGKVYTFSQKNIAQQPGGKSIVAAVSADYHRNEKLVEPYIRMFQNVGFYGLVMVECRHYQKQEYMIEANPRFWGPSQLFCDAQYNFFEYMLYDFGFIPTLPDRESSKETTYYFWGGGFQEDPSMPGCCVWHEDGKCYFQQNRNEFYKADIYNRIDTIDIYNEEQCRE